MFLLLASAPWLLEHVAKRRKQSLFLQIILELLPNVPSIHPEVDPFNFSLLVHLCSVPSMGRSRSLAISCLFQVVDSIPSTSWAISVFKILLNIWDTPHSLDPLHASPSAFCFSSFNPVSSQIHLLASTLAMAFHSPRTTKEEERSGSWWDMAASSFRINITSLGY